VNGKLRIEAQNLHWLTTPETDLCAHGDFVMAKGNQTLLRAENQTESAAAYCLLRTTSEDHTMAHPLCPALIPSCAFTFEWGWPGLLDPRIPTHPGSIDFEVRHLSGEVELKLESEWKVVIRTRDWSEAVVNFSKSVLDFFAAAPAKGVPDYEISGFEGFMAAWRQVHEAVSATLDRQPPNGSVP
jgi:hypothetical protein